MITVDDLTVQIDGTIVLEDVTLTVERGEFVLLVGRNGAGKTTLLDQLSGLDDRLAGSVRIDGTDVRSDPTVRASVGRVFEDPGDQILGATVTGDVAFGPENLGLSGGEIDARVEAAIAAVGLEGHADTPTDALSGGQRARLAIAGAIAMAPDWLVLDEPTAGLDHPGRQAILRYLEQVNDEGTAIILATHDLRDLLTVADRVVGLDAGRIAIDAPPEAAIPMLEDLGVRVPAV